MHSRNPIANSERDTKPWYRHPWPWLLMMGPFLVVVAGIHTTWLAFSRPDALVVDDYYKQGKAINQDLRRDRIAGDMGLEFALRYDAAAGRLSGTIRSHGRPLHDKLALSLVHSTRPEKDVRLQVQPDAEGNFSADLAMLDIARWQVLVEGGQRNWRLNGVWAWPQEQRIDIRPEPVQ